MSFPPSNTFSIFLLVLEVLQRKLTLSGHRCLDWMRRSVILRHAQIELSSSKKNANHFDKVLMSEPLSKPPTGPSIQSLCMKIDSHSCALYLVTFAVARKIHRPCPISFDLLDRYPSLLYNVQSLI
jgi:hypothetical protein